MVHKKAKVSVPTPPAAHEWKPAEHDVVMTKDSWKPPEPPKPVRTRTADDYCHSHVRGNPSLSSSSSWNPHASGHSDTHAESDGQWHYSQSSWKAPTRKMHRSDDSTYN